MSQLYGFSRFVTLIETTIYIPFRSSVILELEIIAYVVLESYGCRHVVGPISRVGELSVVGRHVRSVYWGYR